MSIDPTVLSEKILALVEQRRPDAPEVLDIDVIADFVCPWSYLGFQRLGSALNALEGQYQLTWYPFQLNPDMPAEGKRFDDYLRERFGDPAALAPVLAEIQKLGVAEGVAFDFDKIQRVPNTLSAHRLVYQAAKSNTRDAAAAALFQAFFEHGQDIGDAAILTEIGLSVGMPAEDIATALEDESIATIVKANEKQARSAGITGVPNFLINKHVFVVGAQDRDQMVGAIDRAMFGDPQEQADQPLH